MATTDPDLRDHAGPYGFTRREISVIAAVLAICIAVIGYSEWRDSRRPVPAWVVEDVMLDAANDLLVPDTTTSGSPQRFVPARSEIQSELIDVNSADQRTLARLPGIGTELARRMIEERSTNGAFLNLTDLQRVKGIGPRKAAMLSGWVRFTSDPESAGDTSQTE